MLNNNNNKNGLCNDEKKKKFDRHDHLGFNDWIICTVMDDLSR